MILGGDAPVKMTNEIFEITLLLNEALMVLAAIKIHASVLSPDVTYTTLFVGADTTSKQLVRMLLSKYRMRSRDANLFYIAMRTVCQDARTGELQTTHERLDDDERPSLLSACCGLPGIAIDFHLCSRPGGLVKVNNSCLMAGAKYKGLIIAPTTTAAEVIEMLLNSYTKAAAATAAAPTASAFAEAEDRIEDFDLHEVCRFRKNNRILPPDACPLLLQAKWSNPHYYSFVLKRKLKLKSTLISEARRLQKQVLTPDDYWQDEFGNIYLTQAARRKLLTSALLAHSRPNIDGYGVESIRNNFYQSDTLPTKKRVQGRRAQQRPLSTAIELTATPPSWGGGGGGVGGAGGNFSTFYSTPPYIMKNNNNMLETSFDDNSYNTASLKRMRKPSPIGSPINNVDNNNTNDTVVVSNYADAATEEKKVENVQKSSVKVVPDDGGAANSTAASHAASVTAAAAATVIRARLTEYVNYFYM